MLLDFFLIFFFFCITILSFWWEPFWNIWWGIVVEDSHKFVDTGNSNGWLGGHVHCLGPDSLFWKRVRSRVCWTYFLAALCLAPALRSVLLLHWWQVDMCILYWMARPLYVEFFLICDAKYDFICQICYNIFMSIVCMFLVYCFIFEYYGSKRIKERKGWEVQTTTLLPTYYWTINSLSFLLET